MNCFKKEDKWQAIRLSPFNHDEVRKLAIEKNAFLQSENPIDGSVTFFTPNGSVILRNGDFLLFKGKELKAYKPDAFIEDFTSIDDDWYKHIAKQNGWDPEQHGIVENWIQTIAQQANEAPPQNEIGRSNITAVRKIFTPPMPILIIAILINIYMAIYLPVWLALAYLPMVFVIYAGLTVFEIVMNSIARTRRQLRESAQQQEESEES